MDAITPRNLLATSSATFLLGVLASWGLFYEGRCSSGFKAFDAPAWVQAIGSVTAILVAIAVPAWQQRRKRIDEQVANDRKARSLASVLLNPAKVLLEDVEKIRSEVDTFAASSIGEGDSFHLRVPSKLVELQTDLHLLGEPGSQLLRTLYYLSIANDQADQEGIVWRERLPCLQAALDTAARDARTAIAGMEALLQ